MDAPPARSTDVTSTLTVPLARRPTRQGLDFEALYRAARDDVYAYVATLLGDHAAAEDVTASAFERAYRRQGTYRAARGSERAWGAWGRAPGPGAPGGGGGGGGRGGLAAPAPPRARGGGGRGGPPAAPAAGPAGGGAAPAEDAAEAALRRAALREAVGALPAR